MAKIPNLNNMARNVADGQARVVSIGNTNTVGNLQPISEGLNAIAQRETNLETSKASLDFLKAKNAIELELENDPDYDTHEDRYRETLENSIGEIAGKIGDPRARNEFIQNKKMAYESSVPKIKRNAFAIRSDSEVNKLNEDAAAAREIYLNGSDDDVALIKQAIDSRYDSLSDLGIIGQADAGNLKRKWKVEAATSKIEMMEPEDRLEALKQPFAKNLPSDIQQELRKKASAEHRKNQAVDIVDGFIDKGYDEEDVRERLTHIKSKKVRKEVESRFDYIYNKNKQAEAENQWQLKDKYSYQVLHEGFRIDEIPSDEWNEMDSTTKGFLTQLEADSVKPPTKSDPMAVLQLTELAANEQWEKVADAVKNPRNALSATDRVKFGKIAIDGTMPIEVEDELTDLQAIKLAVETAGITDDKATTLIRDKTAKWRREYIEANNKKPDDRARQSFIDDLLVKTPLDGFPWDTEKPLYEVDDQEWRLSLEEMSDENPEAYGKVMEYFKRKGISPSRPEIVKAYKMFGG